MGNVFDKVDGEMDEIDGGWILSIILCGQGRSLDSVWIPGLVCFRSPE